MSGTATDFPNNPRTNIPRSHGTTQDILGCPTRHDNQSPRSKKSQEVLGQLGTSRDVLPDMTTKVPRCPGTTRDIPGCPTRHDYQSPRSKSPKMSWEYSGHPRMSYIPDMTTKVPGPKVPRCPGTTRDIPGCPIHQT